MNVRKEWGSWGAVCGLLVAGLVLSGCSLLKSSNQQFAEVPGLAPSTEPAVAGASATAPSGTNGSTPLDLIQPGDALVITFTDLPQPTMPIEDRVKQDGTVTLLLNKTFKASGKNRGELEQEIRNCYVPKYYKNMTVNVKLQEQTRFYFVGGEVKVPNRQVYLGGMTVLRAIQSCGDFTDYAKKKAVQLTRADGRKFTINCEKARSNPGLDLDVYPGDTIYVPRKIF